MIQNIVYAIILAVIVVPSWQIGSITLEKKTVAHMLKEHAASIKKYRSGQDELVKSKLKKNLELKGLPTVFTFEVLETGKKVKISYQYNGAATVFGYTYYQVSETISAVTKD